jgi:hypothetical protein
LIRKSCFTRIEIIEELKESHATGKKTVKVEPVPTSLVVSIVP